MTDDLQVALEAFSNRIRRVFNDELIGIYLTGSVALGSYHDGKSDVDFTVLVESPLSDEYFKPLTDVHEELALVFPRVKFEGHYVSKDDLGRQPEEIEPVFAIHDNKLSRSHHDINTVTWFTLKKHGITVWGFPSNELDLSISSEELSAYVIGNVNSYWAKWLSDTKAPFSVKWFAARQSGAVEWGIMGICRMFYTLSEHDVLSKDNAARYALTRVPDRYKRILKEAISIRTGQGERQYDSPLVRMSDMIEFMEYMIHECNGLYTV